MKKIITKQEKLQLLGLVTLGRQAGKDMETVDKAIERLLGKDAVESGFFTDFYLNDGHTSDLDGILKNLGIKVK